jgi:large subunit ribosomal protein L1
MKAKAPQGPVEPAEALAFLKAARQAKFDESVEVSLRLGVDPKKTDQTVRGTLVLPNGSGKTVHVVVFATGPAADAAKQAGADEVGFEEMIEKVKGGWTGFDVAIATPEAMKEVRKLGKVLGPRGLMPNPKTGTVTDDTASAVRESKAGKLEFRMDRHGNVNVPFGRVSFSEQALAENLEAVLTAIKAERPAASKGTFIRSCTVSTTMGVGVKLNVRE